jgi:hypothetical protein
MKPCQRFREPLPTVWKHVIGFYLSVIMKYQDQIVPLGITAFNTKKNYWLAQNVVTCIELTRIASALVVLASYLVQQQTWRNVYLIPSPCLSSAISKLQLTFTCVIFVLLKVKEISIEAGFSLNMGHVTIYPNSTVGEAPCVAEFMFCCQSSAKSNLAEYK